MVPGHQSKKSLNLHVTEAQYPGAIIMYIIPTLGPEPYK